MSNTAVQTVNHTEVQTVSLGTFLFNNQLRSSVPYQLDFSMDWDEVEIWEG